MPASITPKALEPGATIAFISPSARLNDVLPAVMSRATSVLEKRGYTVRTFYNKDTSIQNSISNRLSEIRAAFSDPAVSAIISTIGGTTLTELLPALIEDTELHGIIRANPKIVVGYSDNTCLHWFLHALTGLRTFYGPGALPELGDELSGDDDTTPLAFCVKHLFRAIEEDIPLGDVARSQAYVAEIPPFMLDPASTKSVGLTANPGWKWLRGGKATGRLFGGCLTVVARLQGIRAVVPDWRGRIVFLETAAGEDEVSGNPLYRVQAAFADLIAGGVFDEAAGLVVGRPYGYNSEEQIEQYTGVIKALLCEGRFASSKFPILFGVDFGHTTPMVTLPFDALATLDSYNDKFAILEAAVA